MLKVPPHSLTRAVQGARRSPWCLPPGSRGLDEWALLRLVHHDLTSFSTSNRIPEQPMRALHRKWASKSVESRAAPELARSRELKTSWSEAKVIPARRNRPILRLDPSTTNGGTGSDSSQALGGPEADACSPLARLRSFRQYVSLRDS